MKRINNECYASAQDYFAALEHTKRVLRVLERAKRAILFSYSSQSTEWGNVPSGEELLEIVREIEDLSEQIAE